MAPDFVDHSVILAPSRIDKAEGDGEITENELFLEVRWDLTNDSVLPTDRLWYFRSKRSDG